MSKSPQEPKKRGRKANSRKTTALASERNNAKSGPMAHKDAVKRARELKLITARQQQAFDLLTKGYTMVAIGKTLGVSNYTAFMDCGAVRKAMPLVLGHDGLELFKSVILARCEAIVRSHWKKRGQKSSADVIFRADEQIRAMLGLDAQKAGGFSAEEVARLLSAVRALTEQRVADDETRRLISQDIRRLAQGVVVDVPKEGSNA